MNTTVPIALVKFSVEMATARPQMVDAEPGEPGEGEIRQRLQDARHQQRARQRHGAGEQPAGDAAEQRGDQARRL